MAKHKGIGTLKRVPRHLSTRGLANKYGQPPASRQQVAFRNEPTSVASAIFQP